MNRLRSRTMHLAVALPPGPLRRELVAILQKSGSGETLQDLVAGYFQEVGNRLVSQHGGTKSRVNDKSEPLVRYIVDWNTAESPDSFNCTAVFTLERGTVFYSVFRHEAPGQKPRLLGKQTAPADTSPAALADLVGRVSED